MIAEVVLWHAGDGADAGILLRFWLARCRIERRHAVGLVSGRRVHFPAKSQIERQGGADLPIVLNINADDGLQAVVFFLRRSVAGAGWIAEQHIGQTVTGGRPVAGIGEAERAIELAAGEVIGVEPGKVRAGPDRKSTRL